MNIREWHDHFNNHFTALHEERLGGGYSVFAFEHGLDDERREELKRSIYEHLTRLSPDDRYWLPWVVYSAEIGYEFGGREYWHTFEDKTPGWRVKGNRNFVRNGFKKFVESFGGFKPSGAWANHRPIISYPITHAILPKDFQSRLIRILTTLRPYLRTLIQSPRLLGKKIAEHSYHEPERFQQFAQNNELIGLIAREILTVDEKGSENAILISTFRRIISDIRNKEAAALDDARSFIKGKYNIRGKNSQTLKPQLILRRVESRNWDILLELPDLLPLAEKSQAAEDFLQSALPRIECLTGTLGKGLLVNHGATLKQLRAMPKDGEQLVNFRHELPKELEEFFKKTFVFDLPALTVFSAQTDGLAQRQESNVVRPESNYIVMCREEVKGNALIKPLETSCENVFLYSLSSESLTDKDNRSFLQELGLEVETDFRLVPVGLPPTKWDGESKIEFLDGEAPTFALKLDLPWDTVRIRLEDFDELEIENQSASEYTYFALPVLATGLYKLSYESKEENDADFQLLGEISIGVKERAVWHPGTTSQNALLLLPDPVKPTFEQLFDGKVRFEIFSPETSVTVSISLLGKNAEDPPLIKKNITTVALPRDAEKVNEAISRAIEDPKLLEKLEVAQLCRLNFESAELGSVPLDFRREFHPIQWEVKSDRAGKTILNLSEESFGDEKTEIHYYKFETPDAPSELHFERYFPDYAVPESGGLFVAATPKQRKGITVLGATKITKYNSLSAIEKSENIKPTFQTYARTVSELAKLIDLYCLWNASRPFGNYGKKDLEIVFDAFVFNMVCLIDDGQCWRKEESSYCQNVKGVRERDAIIKAISNKPSILSELKKLSVFGCITEELVTALTNVFKSEIGPESIRKNSTSNGVRSIVKIIKQEWFVEFALRLCSRPEALKEWAQTEERFHIGLNKMLATPSLVRAARFIVLSTRYDELGNANTGYKWDWE